MLKWVASINIYYYPAFALLHCFSGIIEA